jgi:hypothetical protein
LIWPCQFPECMWFYPLAILPPLTVEYHGNSQPVHNFILSHSSTTDH